MMNSRALEGIYKALQLVFKTEEFVELFADPTKSPPGCDNVHEPKVTTQQLSESLFCKSHFLFSFQSQRHITHTQTCLYSQNHEKKQQPQESNDTRYRIQ
jgi:hypothetical protein